MRALITPIDAGRPDFLDDSGPPTRRRCGRSRARNEGTRGSGAAVATRGSVPHGIPGVSRCRDGTVAEDLPPIARDSPRSPKDRRAAPRLEAGVGSEPTDASLRRVIPRTLRPSDHVPAVAVAVAFLFAPPLPAAPWPAWRGSQGDGTTPEKAFPLHWSPTRNVRWRTELPDRGNSTPIVWGDRVFLTQAVEQDHSRTVRAYDRATGRELWKAGTVWERPEETHEDNPYCAASPVTDGERVIAAFGSAGVWAFDVEGKKLWNRDLGPQRHQWGHASSPVLHGDRVFVYHGPGPNAKAYALDKKSGATLWEVELPEPVPTVRTDGFKGRAPGVVGSFGTPLVTRAGDRTELVLSLPESLRALAPDDGRELWRADGLNPLVYTSPFAADGLVVAMGGFNGSSLAVRTGGRGDVTATHRVWHEIRSKKNRIGPAVAHQGHIYLVNMEGFLECLELATGRQLWEERLDGPGAQDGSWSALALAGDRLYAMNRSGDGFVIRASPRFEVLATNTVAEPLNASPALADGEILLRTWKALWCLGEKRVTARGAVSTRGI